MESLKQYLFEMIRHSRKLAASYLTIIVLSIISSLFTVVSSLFGKKTIDIVVEQTNFSILIRYAIYLFSLYILTSLLNILNTYVNANTSNKLDYRFKEYFFDSIQRSTYLLSTNKETTDIYYRMYNDISLLSSYFLKLILTIPVNIVSIVIYLIIMFMWSPLLTIFLITMCIIQLVLAHLIKSPIKKNRENIIVHESRFVFEIGQHFNAIETVKIFGLEELKLKDLGKIIDSLLKVKIKSTFVMSVLSFLSGVAGQVSNLGLLILGGVLIFNGEISVGTFLGFNIITGAFSAPINNLVNIIFGYEEVKVSYERYKSFISSYNDYEYSGDIKFSFNNKLEINNVCFSYNDSNYVLQNLDATLYPGQVIGIIGESGSGKSTIAKLLIRLIKPSYGNIEIDGIDIKTFNHREYRKNICYLSQTPYIFSGTIRENILIGIDSIDEDFLKDLLIKSGVQDILNKLTDGINTIIGKGGTLLSVGECQRIAIARALIRKPKIVILDEPTSALDEHFEMLVTNLFEEYSSKFNALVIIITHKLNTLSNIETIYELSNYELVEITKEREERKREFNN